MRRSLPSIMSRPRGRTTGGSTRTLRMFLCLAGPSSVSNAEHVLPPPPLLHFFCKGQGVTKEVFLERPEERGEALDCLPSPRGRCASINRMRPRAHTSYIVENWRASTCSWSKDFWSHSSPNCNPLDYCERGILERESNERDYNLVDSLQVSIVNAVARMDTEHLVNTCHRLRTIASRL